MVTFSPFLDKDVSSVWVHIPTPFLAAWCSILTSRSKYRTMFWLDEMSKSWNLDNCQILHSPFRKSSSLTHKFLRKNCNEVQKENQLKTIVGLNYNISGKSGFVFILCKGLSLYVRFFINKKASVVSHQSFYSRRIGHVGFKWLSVCPNF